MNRYKHRLHRLEAAYGTSAQVYAIHLADTDEMVVLSMRSVEEHERMPRAVFEQRYPDGPIVDSLGAAWMREAI